MPLPIIIIITDIIEYIIVFILYVNWRILKKQKKNIEESFSFPVLFFPFLIFSFFVSHFSKRIFFFKKVDLKKNSLKTMNKYRLKSPFFS